MTSSAQLPRMTVEAFLAWEREQVDRHEFHDGAVFAMAGGSPRHNALVAALLGELRGALRDGPCRALSSDQRVALAGERYVYPDGAVVCGPPQLEHGDVLTNPTAIFEVLSSGTEAYDRGNKWEGYRRLPSLDDYLLVSQQVARIEQFQRQGDGTWRYSVAESGDQVTLCSGAVIDIDAVYAGTFDLPSDEKNQ